MTYHWRPWKFPTHWESWKGWFLASLPDAISRRLPCFYCESGRELPEDCLCFCGRTNFVSETQ